MTKILFKKFMAKILKVSLIAKFILLLRKKLDKNYNTEGLLKRPFNKQKPDK